MVAHPVPRNAWTGGLASPAAAARVEDQVSWRLLGGNDGCNRGGGVARVERVELDEEKGIPGGEHRRGGSRRWRRLRSHLPASYPRLVGQLYVVTTSRADAEEVVQDAFARPWARWEQMGGHENIEAWVRRVATNVAVGPWRRTLRECPLQEIAVCVRRMVHLAEVASTATTRPQGLRRRWWCAAPRPDDRKDCRGCRSPPMAFVSSDGSRFGHRATPLHADPTPASSPRSVRRRA